MTYTDRTGNIWREILVNERAVFLEDESGERFTFAWVDERFGPLIPERA